MKVNMIFPAEKNGFPTIKTFFSTCWPMVLCHNEFRMYGMNWAVLCKLKGE